jgi:hypothetical protein
MMIVRFIYSLYIFSFDLTKWYYQNQQTDWKLSVSVKSNTIRYKVTNKNNNVSFECIDKLYH